MHEQEIQRAKDRVAWLLTTLETTCEPTKPCANQGEWLQAIRKAETLHGELTVAISELSRLRRNQLEWRLANSPL